MPKVLWPEMPGCLLRLRYAQVSADSANLDELPDWSPIAGQTGLLVPSIRELVVYDPQGAKIVVELDTVQVEVDEDGWLCKRTGEGVLVPLRVAPTDDPLMSSQGWTYTLMLGARRIGPFHAPSSGVVELADYVTAPVTDATKAWVERIPELVELLVSIKSVTRDGDDMVVALSNGSVSRLPLPKGDPGADSTVPGPPGPPGAVPTSTDYLIVGPGRPDIPATTGGTITGSEPVGAEYRSTDGASVGAWVWMKRPGSGWEVTDGDTGWRKVTLLAGTANQAHLRRQGALVTMTLDRFSLQTSNTTIYDLPTGFRLTKNATDTVSIPATNDSGTQFIGKVGFWDGIRVQWKAGSATQGSLYWALPTNDPWPTTLPGTPA